ncbi:MAG: hypothetical protein GMKNLPBB_03371 [Myxococcota bacterium]|nr:hypothetical protein [Myxococcota bacterium]
MAWFFLPGLPQVSSFPEPVVKPLAFPRERVLYLV